MKKEGFKCIEKFKNGYAPSFLGEFSHDTIIVASFLNFLNVLKLSDLMLFFHGEKHKKVKKSRQSDKYFNSYLHNKNTLGYNSNRFWKLQCRATTFIR